MQVSAQLERLVADTAAKKSALGGEPLEATLRNPPCVSWGSPQGGSHDGHLQGPSLACSFWGGLMMVLSSFSPDGHFQGLMWVSLRFLHGGSRLRFRCSGQLLFEVFSMSGDQTTGTGTWKAFEEHIQTAVSCCFVTEQHVYN